VATAGRQRVQMVMHTAGPRWVSWRYVDAEVADFAVVAAAAAAAASAVAAAASAAASAVLVPGPLHPSAPRHPFEVSVVKHTFGFRYLPDLGLQ